MKKDYIIKVLEMKKYEWENYIIMTEMYWSDAAKK